jgi:hypothetical protein
MPVVHPWPGGQLSAAYGEHRTPGQLLAPLSLDAHPIATAIRSALTVAAASHFMRRGEQGADRRESALSPCSRDVGV